MILVRFLSLSAADQFSEPQYCILRALSFRAGG